MRSKLVNRHIPTMAQWLDKRAAAKRNRLPEHLRPRPVWPVWIQIFLNLGIAYTLMHLMFNRDEYYTETGPAFVIGICLFLLIFTIIEGLTYRARYRGKPGGRLAKINFVLLIFAFICLPFAIYVFMS
jgi:hypothetical protein